ncbi:MAG: hypothetical protein EAX90_09475 [Candidatus Heimdallarchaeota archaeon]|nr:hypothetical protein [Candidatus Heimdallarchaeota archaeon]
MSEEKIVVKDDWKTILGELDEIVREIAKFSSMTLGDKNAFEGEEFPALIHFINEIKMEKKSKSWDKIEKFANLATENLKFLEETQQIKMQNKLLDRTFIGALPKNTDEIGNKTMEILNEIPEVLRTINESVEAMLIDIKLKLDFPIIKFEKEILDIKHQIDLLEENIKTHSKTKKGFASKDEQIVYTQAYRETYHEIIEKAQSYVIRDLMVHSKAFEDVYERYQAKIENYRNNPAFDDFVKDNCIKTEQAIDSWPKEGFKAFNKALTFIRKIDTRLSDTRQTYIQQIKSELDKDTNEMITNIEQLWTLEEIIEAKIFTRLKESSEKVISAVKFFLRTVDVISSDPFEKLVNDEKILANATLMTTAAYEGTFGSFEEKLDKFLKQVSLSKNSKKVLDEINETRVNCLDPNSLTDAINTIPAILNYKKTIDLLLKEIAVDIVDIQEKFVKRIKNINKYLGATEAIELPSQESFVKLEKVNLDDTTPLEKIEKLLKKSLADAAKVISEFEVNFSEGLGISINPNLEGKIERFKRPSYKPNVKQANKAMADLEKFAKDLAKDTGEAISNYSKGLKKFSVKSSALKSFQDSLNKIAKDASSEKVNLSQITTRLEQVVEEYSNLLNDVLITHASDLGIIMKNMKSIDISDKLSLENFDSKHEELVSNISLESVKEQQQLKEEEIVCKKCGGKIVWKKEDYNDMLGLDVLLVRCENGHEDNIIGFGEEKEETKIETLEIKCAKCDSEILSPVGLDIFTKDSLIVTVACPKNHETEFIIKKK